MTENSAWYEKFSNVQLIFFGFILLGVTPLIRNPEYFEILTNIGTWDTPRINEVIEAILTDGFMGALVGLWFVFRKKRRS